MPPNSARALVSQLMEVTVGLRELGSRVFEVAHPRSLPEAVDGGALCPCRREHPRHGASHVAVRGQRLGWLVEERWRCIT
jgi:hypothetical protein